MTPTLISRDMHYWRMAPDPRLRPWVLCYFLARPVAASPCSGPPHDEELLMPDGHSEIVFTVDGSYERWRVGEGGRREVMSDSYVIGGRSHSVLTRDLGPVTVAGIKLDPRALRWLIATPLVAFRDSTLDLRALNQRALLELEESVAHARGAPDVGALFDGYLLRALRDMPAPVHPVDHLLEQIRATRGALSIMHWLHASGYDARHIERCFCAATGLTPKRYARVVRFKHSYHELVAKRPRGAASHAASSHLDGFCDQSHFNKEFRAFIGAAPTARLTATMGPATSISDHLLAGELSPA
jgi:AraC-like DNA-binding protein